MFFLQFSVSSSPAQKQSFSGARLSYSTSIGEPELHFVAFDDDECNDDTLKPVRFENSGFTMKKTVLMKIGSVFCLNFLRKNL